MRRVGSLTAREGWSREFIEYLSLLHIYLSQFSLIYQRIIRLSFASFDSSDQCTCRTPSYLSPSSDLFTPWLSWSHLCVSRWNPCILPRTLEELKNKRGMKGLLCDFKLIICKPLIKWYFKENPTNICNNLLHSIKNKDI